MSVALFGVSACSALAGAGMTWVSACCGSREASDPTFLLLGLLVAGVVGVAGAGMWRASMTRRTLAGATLTVPAVCALAAISSSDFATVLTLAVPAWVLFWWFLGRPRTAQWLGT